MNTKNIDTKQILNIGLLIGAFLIGKKLLTTFGIIKTAEEKEQEQKVKTLEEDSQGDQTIINQKANLSLTPNYFMTIFKYQLNKNPKFKTYTQSQKDAAIKVYVKNYLGNPASYLKLAEIISKSKSVWFYPDSEEKAFGVFRLLKSQAQISYLAYRFFELYKTDMLGFLKTFMNTEQLAEVKDIIKNKPLYALR